MHVDVDSGFLIRLIAIVLLGGRYTYWTGKEITDHIKSRKLQKLSGYSLVKRIFITLLVVLLFLQLLGLQLFTFEKNLFIQIVGLIIVVIAVGISVIARKELGMNWVHAAEYQIKNKQTLVTSGIYSYIRHPIYLSMILIFGGVELIVASYLFYYFLITISISSYFQAKKEESILEDYFKKNYCIYKSRSKMFIPKVF